jgi:hypothetical protein
LPTDESGGKKAAKGALLKALDRLLDLTGQYFEYLSHKPDDILRNLEFLFRTSQWGRIMLVPGKFDADKFAIVINKISSELGKLGKEAKTKENIQKMKLLLNLSKAVTDTISAYYLLEVSQISESVESVESTESLWEWAESYGCVVQNQYL